MIVDVNDDYGDDDDGDADDDYAAEDDEDLEHDGNTYGGW